jgi:hypothetical protein
LEGSIVRATSVEFVRLLHRATQSPSVGAARLPKRVELDTIDVLSLLAAASWNVNFMLLDRFLRETGFLLVHRGQHACRYVADIPVVLLLVEFASRRHPVRHASLVFAECDRYRACGAFLEGAVAFIRDGDVVTCPVELVEESLLRASSLFAIAARPRRTDRPDERIPPAA